MPFQLLVIIGAVSGAAFAAASVAFYFGLRRIVSVSVLCLVVAPLIVGSFATAGGDISTAIVATLLSVSLGCLIDSRYTFAAGTLTGFFYGGSGASLALIGNVELADLLVAQVSGALVGALVGAVVSDAMRQFVPSFVFPLFFVCTIALGSFLAIFQRSTLPDGDVPWPVYLGAAVFAVASWFSKRAFPVFVVFSVAVANCIVAAGGNGFLAYYGMLVISGLLGCVLRVVWSPQLVAQAKADLQVIST